ncbi:MAG: hypothetical protein KGV44_01380 [Flavobacteriaceae bacterium]|nr:hypothetical protein [Flavobacteriaceae bacterium]
MPNPFKKIIKNTESSNPTYKKGRKNHSEVKTNICPNCKAPRPVDTNLTTCDYCGFQFMNIDVKIKPDNND